MGRYKGGAWIEDDVVNIQTLRRRVHITYITPFKVHYEEDYSLYIEESINNESIQYVELDIQHVKPSLKISDSEGTLLEFHRKIEEYYSSYNSSENSSDELTSTSLIEIDLPFEKGIFSQTLKTIYLDYYQFTPSHIRNTSNIFIPLNVAAHTHIFVEKPSNFEWDFFSTAMELDSNNYISLENLIQNGYIKIERHASQIEIISTALIENCVLSIDIKFHLHKAHRYWLNSGIVLGIVGILVDSLLILSLVPDKIKIILPFTTIVISYLLITKGWIFSKDLDKIENIDIVLFRKNFSIPYDFAYIFLIAIQMTIVVIYLIYLIWTDP